MSEQHYAVCAEPERECRNERCACPCHSGAWALTDASSLYSPTSKDDPLATYFPDGLHPKLRIDDLVAETAERVADYLEAVVAACEPLKRQIAAALASLNDDSEVLHHTDSSALLDIINRTRTILEGAPPE